MAWARNRYGVFPESGFAGDGRYPESFVYAGEERPTVGCNQTGHEVSEAFEGGFRFWDLDIWEPKTFRQRRERDQWFRIAAPLVRHTPATEMQ